MARKHHSTEKQPILALPARRAIFLVVRAYAGCHFREIERRSGLSTGVVKYHLDYLTRHGIIRQEKTDNHVRYFPQDVSRDDQALLGLLRVKSIRTVVLCLLVQRAPTHANIVKFVGLSRSTVSWHLKRLVKFGVVRVSAGRYALVISKEKVMRLLITYKESFFDSLVDRTIEMWDVGT